ncbi:E3 ubiquitin-protein ligase bre1 [Geranomyces michiganensis]|nr:E3 ubiquitin-protein ligase bre1 [Geranomyces michiganensis]
MSDGSLLKRRVDDEPSLELPHYPSKRLNSSSSSSSAAVTAATSQATASSSAPAATASSSATVPPSVQDPHYTPSRPLPPSQRSDDDRGRRGSVSRRPVRAEPPARLPKDLDYRTLPRVEDEDPDGEIPGSQVTAFQKAAIWRQMQHYKRESLRAADRIAELEDQQLVYDSSLVLANTYMRKVFEDLRHFMTRLDDSQAVKDSKDTNAPYRSELLQEIINPGQHPAKVDSALQQTWTATTALLKELLQRVDQTVDGRRSAGDISLDQQLLDERAKVDQLQARLEARSAKILELEGSLHGKQRRLLAVNAQLSEASERLASAERAIDRLKMNPSPTTVPEISADEGNQHQQPARSDVDVDSVAHIAETRLADIQRLRAKNMLLIEELEKLHLVHANHLANDEQIRETPVYRNLDEEYKYQLGENELLRQRLDTMSAELDETRIERTKLIEDMEAEEMSRRKIVEAELKRLESDLTRIRANRDQLQHNLDLRCSKDELDVQQVNEIRVVANTRKDRILCLEQDVHRLRTHMAANTGDRALIAFFELNPEGNPIEDLRQKLKDAHFQVQELKDKLGDQSAPDTTQRAKVDDLENELKSFKKMFGEEAPGSDALTVLKERLEATEKELDLAKCRLEAFEKTDARLSSEIETLGKAWSELEEQNSRKILDLAEKEDTIVRLLAEKTKLEHKQNITSKQVVTNNNIVIALRKQSDRQLEQIRHFEPRDKALTQQVTLLEREVAAHKASFDQQQRAIADHMRDITKLKAAERSLILKLENANTVLKKHVALLDSEQEKARVANETAGALQRKLDKMATKNEGTADSGVLKELDDYKRLAKCSTCQTNFKSHALAKCMHVFCKTCIDNAYTSRQRKCPTCGERFGEKEVRQIYL